MPASGLSYPKLIKESVEALQQLEREQKKSYLQDRIRFIGYLKEGILRSQPQAGALIGLESRQSQNLWKQYREKGIASLLQERKPTHLGKLSSVEYSRLLQHLDQDDMMSQKQVRAYLQAEMGKDYTQPAIHYLFKGLKVKLKTGRLVNVPKDKVGEEGFKKMPDLTESYGQKHIYFTDEMRYGTRTAAKRRWSRQGRRPICKVKIGYEWGYLFLALCPATADMFACYCSHLDKACFEYFITEFDKL